MTCIKILPISPSVCVEKWGELYSYEKIPLSADAEADFYKHIVIQAHVGVIAGGT